MDYFDFGLDLQLPPLAIEADGRARLTGEGAMRCAPYFELTSIPEDATPDSRLSHFITKPFPGHEWNHFALHAIQRAPIEIVRGVAHAALPSTESPPDVTWRLAPSDAIRESLGHFEKMLRIYHSLLGRKATRLIVEASRTIISAKSFVCEQSKAQVQTATNTQAGDAAQHIDEAYLHASFTAEAFHAFLDARVHHAQGRDPEDFLHERAKDTPLLTRLRDLSPPAACKFLISWHRKSYKFPRFTKKLFRSIAKLPVRQGKLGEPPEGADAPRIGL